MPERLSEETFAALGQLDTCSAANAIERFGVQLRNEGFANGGTLQSRFPNLPPMLGYAMTLRVRSANPPMEGGTYIDRTDWWQRFDPAAGPYVLVIEDIDRHPGVGAFIGHVHSAILQSLGCIGAVTNGAVRDLHLIESSHFHLFSGTISPSHAYTHIIEAGGVVQVAGLRVHPGDLLLGDRHGIVRIPLAIADKIPATAERLRAEDKTVIDYCRQPDFNLRELQSRVEGRRVL